MGSVFALDCQQRSLCGKNHHKTSEPKRTLEIMEILLLHFLSGETAREDGASGCIAGESQKWAELGCSVSFSGFQWADSSRIYVTSIAYDILKIRNIHSHACEQIS